MGINPWAIIPRKNFLRRIFLLVFLIGSFAFVRFTKGAIYLDLYALVTRPFWPGSAQSEWLKNSLKLENKARLILINEE